MDQALKNPHFLSLCNCLVLRKIISVYHNNHGLNFEVDYFMGYADQILALFILGKGQEINFEFLVFQANIYQTQSLL